jgi:hypothetical protein
MYCGAMLTPSSQQGMSFPLVAIESNFLGETVMMAVAAKQGVSDTPRDGKKRAKILSP